MDIRDHTGRARAQDKWGKDTEKEMRTAGFKLSWKLETRQYKVYPLLKNNDTKTYL